MKFKRPYKLAKNTILNLNEEDYFSYNKNPMGGYNETALTFNGIWAIKDIDLRKDLEKAKTIEDKINIFLNASKPYNSRSSLGDLTYLIKKHFNLK